MNRSISFNFSSLIGVLLLLIFGYFLFSIVKVIYIGLLYASPILLISILVMKREVLLSYFKKIITNIRQNPMIGILNGLFSLIFLPFTLVGMLVKILITKKIENLQKEQQPTNATLTNEYIEFEDLSTDKRPERKTIDDWKIESWEDRKM